VGDEIDHATMLNVPIVQKKIAGLIGLDVNTLRFDLDISGFAQRAASLSQFNEIVDRVGTLTAVF
jgi:L-cystine uptake protein TcyP (sodium:dicarboxylate symporter family)